MCACGGEFTLLPSPTLTAHTFESTEEKIVNIQNQLLFFTVMPSVCGQLEYSIFATLGARVVLISDPRPPKLLTFVYLK